MKEANPVQMDITLESNGEAQVHKQGSIRLKEFDFITGLMDTFGSFFGRITQNLKEYCKITPFDNCITKK